MIVLLVGLETGGSTWFWLDGLGPCSLRGFRTAYRSPAFNQGSFPAAAAGSGGRIVWGSVVNTPRRRETGRPRAAQFAPWAVYIRGATWFPKARSAGW